MQNFSQPSFSLKICAVDLIYTLCGNYCGIMTYLHNFILFFDSVPKWRQLGDKKSGCCCLLISFEKM